MCESDSRIVGESICARVGPRQGDVQRARRDCQRGLVIYGLNNATLALLSQFEVTVSSQKAEHRNRVLFVGPIFRSGRAVCQSAP